MKARRDEALLALENARQALRDNDRTQARQWAERAAKLAPKMEDPWLILAAVASPPLSLDYIRRALKLNPESARARRGMQWALQRLQQPEASLAETQKTPALGQTARRPARTPRAAQPASRPAVRQPARNPFFAIVLLVLGCLVFVLAAWSATTSPVVASILQQPPQQSEPTASASWAEVDIPKPTATAAALADAFTATPQAMTTATESQRDLSTPVSTGTPTGLPTDLSTASATEMAADLPAATGGAETSIPTAEPTWSGSLSLEYVLDTPTSEVPTPAAPSSPGSGHWIDVNLTQQRLYAYDGDTLMNSFLVSTGTWLHPTVTGNYHIYVKLRYTDMSGPDYYLPDVPYTMYFYQSYGLHGTYWHHNFGTPMSHGCVNLSIPDSAWLYNFSSVGTLVSVHY